MTLRCLRCGDPFDPAEEISQERCGACESKLSQALVWKGEDAMWRMILRYRKGTERHPTVLALDALETVPHGTLKERDHDPGDDKAGVR